MKKTAKFKELLLQDETSFLMEAHNGISAKIVEEAGFAGIWGSGLSISAAMGVRDNNEASWTQVLEVVEFMTDVAEIPMMLDADTGYGNFNNVRRLVRKLEQRGVAAMCLEDKLFPKTNSFIGGEQQPLAEIDEFVGKIKAAKDTQTDSDFCVVARVEALITGWGLAEALKRAEAYHRAGADAILIHSKKSSFDEIRSFTDEWQNACPVVIVPTTYDSTPTEEFAKSKISLVIWANHMLRASINSMQRLAAEVQKKQTLISLDTEIVPVKEIFRLQNAGELEAAEKRYLPDSMDHNLDENSVEIPTWQQKIRARCVHSTGNFIEFSHSDIHRSIPDRFEQIVARFPDRLALKSHDGLFTYGELNKAANRIARQIVKQHGSSSEPVGLLFEPGSQAIVAILGVLKAGKICVPLDADFPQKRNRHILKDVNADLCLTNNKSLDEAGILAGDAIQVINVDDNADDLSDENLTLRIGPDFPAFIIYTSGATGRPKGVVQDHRNVLHKAMAFINSIHVCSEDRVILLYSHSASGSIRDIYSTLLNGAALFPHNVKKSGFTQLRDLLYREEITVYNSVATVYRHLTNCMDKRDKPSKLRVVNLGSETIYKKDVDLYREHFSRNCIFLARLGSTELSPVREYFIDFDTEIASDTIPAGYPVTGADVYLLDDNGNPVANGNIGEIVVRSRYLPSAYWGNPELSLQKFIPDPEGGKERIFYTGDMGVLQEDGCLFHHGRKDFQVKVRGHRVEVSEIEMAIMAVPLVKEVVVEVVEDSHRERRLVAYIVPFESAKLDIYSIRGALADDLPDYMIPSLFIKLKSLPLTPVGKVDRRALPAPEFTRSQTNTPFTAPRTPIEESLATVWSDVLGIDRTGIHDDFLELGGQSLQAIQIISRVISAFSVELPVQSLFDTPTVEKMALVIRDNLTNQASQGDIERMLEELEAR